MRLLLGLLFIIYCSGEVAAQRVCSTDILPEVIYTNPGFFQGRDTLSNEVIIIPVVIHVLYKNPQQNISTAQILSQLTALNNDFRMLNSDRSDIPAVFRGVAADTRIQFCLARVDPNGRPTSGIIRKPTHLDYFSSDESIKFSVAGGDNAWDSKRYLNIWVCNMFGRSLGYASIPGGPVEKDGVVINWDVFGTTGSIRAPFNKGRTTTHEIGHWMGLKHIWGDELCGDDGIDDTPEQKSYNYYCPVFPKVSNCSPNGYGDMFMNFMDLTDDGCMNMFTTGQKTRMRALFAENGLRNSFLNSAVCDSSLATGGPLPEDTAIYVKKEPYLEIYPNPVTNHIRINAQNDYQLEGKSCTIYNVQGRKLIQHRFNTNKVQIDVTNLPAGIYFLRLDGNDQKMHKLVKY